MPLARKLFATSLIAAACTVPGALLFTPTASAEPAPPPAPILPALPNWPFLTGLSPANAPALIQSLATAFTGAPAAVAPAAPAPAAAAPVTLPQAPALPAAPIAPVAPAAPLATAAPAQGLVPSAEVNLPQVPLAPTPLPQQLNFPADLTSLIPAGIPLANLLPAPAAAPAPAPAPAAPAPATAGLAGLPPLLMATCALSALP